MISSVLALMLAASAVQADPANDARRAYQSCLRAFMTASLERRMEPEAFETALASQCTSHATAYRDAMVRRDARNGGSRAQAEEDSQIMIDDAKANTVEYYRDSLAANTPPG